MKNNSKYQPIQNNPGCGLLIQAQKKSFAFKHDDVTREKSYNLGGLYSEDVEHTSSSAKTTISCACESVLGPSPTTAEKTNLGDALRALPQILSNRGMVCRDKELQLFHDKVKVAKNHLVKNSQQGIVSPDIMAQAEKFMESYNLEGFMIKVIAIRVSDSDFRGSRKRPDGKFEARQTLRTTIIKDMPTQDELNSILELLKNAVSGSIVSNKETITNYQLVSDKPNKTFRVIPNRSTNMEYQGSSVESKRRLPSGLIKKSSNFS